MGDFQHAPLYEEIARGPEGGRAYWLTTRDGVRLRAGHWPARKSNDRADDDALSGTILLFPGRTEYIEKYGLIAKELADLGLHTLTIDWRGQGLADRPDQERAVGHVGDFAEYQLDVAALTELAVNLNLPKPWYLIGHSMGGCIGLRALHQGIAVEGAVFSAPMWGIAMAPALRPVAWSLSWALHMSPLRQMLAPGTKRETYLSLAPFEDNLLTTDPEMYDYMRTQALAHPELTLGGPTTGWLYAALREIRTLMMPPPPVNSITFLGTGERIVMATPIIRYVENWTNGQLVTVDGAEHEVLMESATTRQQVYDALKQLAHKKQPTEPA